MEASALSLSFSLSQQCVFPFLSMLCVCMHRSLAKLGYRPPHSTLQQLSEGSLRLMRQASAQDLSLTCYSFGVLGYKPPEAWWTGFWASSGAKMQQASSQGLANTFWALGRLKKVRPFWGVWSLWYYYVHCCRLQSWLCCTRPFRP